MNEYGWYWTYLGKKNAQGTYDFAVQYRLHFVFVFVFLLRGNKI